MKKYIHKFVNILHYILKASSIFEQKQCLHMKSILFCLQDINNVKIITKNVLYTSKKKIAHRFQFRTVIYSRIPECIATSLKNETLVTRNR